MALFLVYQSTPGIGALVPGLGHGTTTVPVVVPGVWPKAWLPIWAQCQNQIQTQAQYQSFRLVLYRAFDLVM
jgi:hypothetical protein